MAAAENLGAYDPLVAELTSEISLDAAIAESRAIASQLRALAADRRQQLIEATLEVLLGRLLTGVTLSRRGAPGRASNWPAPGWVTCQSPTSATFCSSGAAMSPGNPRAARVDRPTMRAGRRPRIRP